MRKKLKIIFILIFLTFFLVTLIGKSLTRHINYNNFISSASYFSMSKNEILIADKNFDNIFIKDYQIENINDLLKNSEYVLKVKLSSEPTFYGNGIINNLKVLKVYKTEDEKIKKDNIIQVYDLVYSFNEYYANYYGGMTPLSSKYEYIIFIKKAINPNVKNTYIFASIIYGHFNISIKNSNILDNYSQGELNLKSIMNYDYIDSEYNDYSEKYSKMKAELLEKIEIN